MHLVDGSSGQQQRKEGEEALILSAEAWRVGRSKVRKKDLICGLFCLGSQILVKPALAHSDVVLKREAFERDIKQLDIERLRRNGVL